MQHSLKTAGNSGINRVMMTMHLLLLRLAFTFVKRAFRVMLESDKKICEKIKMLSSHCQLYNCKTHSVS